MPEGEIRDKMYWKASSRLLPAALKVEGRTCLLGRLFLVLKKQVNDLWVVATRGPRGSGHWSLSQASPPEVIASRELAVERVNFRSRQLGAGQLGVELAHTGGRRGVCWTEGRAGLTAVEPLHPLKNN